MTEAVFYPVFLVFVLALVRALERPTVTRQLGLAAALGLAFATRTQSIVLVGAVMCAVVIYGLAQASIKSVVLAFVPTWVLYAMVGAAAGGLALIGALEATWGLWSPAPRVVASTGPRALDGIECHIAFARVGRSHRGSLPSWCRGDAEARRSQGGAGAGRRFGFSGAGTASVGRRSLRERVRPGTVHERNLFFVAPLIGSARSRGRRMTSLDLGS